MGDVFYSASKVDLFYPARRGNFFPAGLPDTEAALCAEMSRLAYSRQEPYFSFDKDQISQALGRLQFVCQFYESKGTPDGRGTHCFLALHHDQDPKKQLAVVAFRGTDAGDPTDLLADAEVAQIDWAPGGRVHAGFAHTLDHVREDLDADLRQIRCRKLFTGHSLGAAMATLLASLHRPDALYTIGSPRVGNADFVAALKGIAAYRFVDCCDIVARIPPETLPGDISYTHFGAPSYIDRDRGITLDPPQKFMDDDRIRAAAEYALKYAWRTGNAGFRELADHAPINYGAAISANPAEPTLSKW